VPPLPVGKNQREQGRPQASLSLFTEAGRPSPLIIFFPSSSPTDPAAPLIVISPAISAFDLCLSTLTADHHTAADPPSPQTRNQPSPSSPICHPPAHRTRAPISILSENQIILFLPFSLSPQPPGWKLSSPQLPNASFLPQPSLPSPSHTAAADPLHHQLGRRHPHLPSRSPLHSLLPPKNPAAPTDAAPFLIHRLSFAQTVIQQQSPLSSLSPPTSLAAAAPSHHRSTSATAAPPDLPPEAEEKKKKKHMTYRPVGEADLTKRRKKPKQI